MTTYTVAIAFHHGVATTQCRSAQQALDLLSTPSPSWICGYTLLRDDKPFTVSALVAAAQAETRQAPAAPL